MSLGREVLSLKADLRLQSLSNPVERMVYNQGHR